MRPEYSFGSIILAVISLIHPMSFPSFDKPRINSGGNLAATSQQVASCSTEDAEKRWAAHLVTHTPKVKKVKDIPITRLAVNCGGLFRLGIRSMNP